MIQIDDIELHAEKLGVLMNYFSFLAINWSQSKHFEFVVEGFLVG